MIDLIIKPTGRCNFNCTFCSATDVGTNIQHPADGRVPQQLKEYIQKANISRIIVTGGEPLMVEPAYYYELHSICRNVNIGITSNLKNFYLDPDKWSKLFREPWFGVGTSFHYGNSRLWDANTVYTEEMFRKVHALYKDRVGKRLSFISVVDNDNEDRAIDNVLLAKDLGAICKLNGAIGVGKQGYTYPVHKMFKIYMKIIDMGLEEWETNCKERYSSRCPRNHEYQCNEYIRCAYMGTDDKLHVGICDETLAEGWELPEDRIYGEGIYRPSQADFITPECACCNLCRVCNACNVRRNAAKTDPNFCEEMKKIEQDLIDYGFKI